jgi:hypothetical protein
MLVTINQNQEVLMVTRWLAFLLLVAPFSYAAATSQNDWIDDLCLICDQGKMNLSKAIQTLEERIKKDEHDIELLKSKLNAKGEEGVLGGIRAGTYKVELVTLQQSLKLHTKALAYVKSLSKNERDRDKFIDTISTIKKLSAEIAARKTGPSKESMTDSVKDTAVTLSKEAYLTAQKALLNGSILTK